MSASKAESQKIFEKLKLKPANKVRINTPPQSAQPAGLFGHCPLTVFGRVDML
jgi:hypothetical protein